MPPAENALCVKAFSIKNNLLHRFRSVRALPAKKLANFHSANIGELSLITSSNVRSCAVQTTQIQTLYQQGVSPAEIAAILGLSATAVDGYLGIAAPGASVLAGLAPVSGPTGSAFPSIS